MGILFLLSFDNDLSQVTSDFLKKQNCKSINILGCTGAINTNAENNLRSITKYLNITKVDNVSDFAFINENYHFPPTALATFEDSSINLVPVK